MNTEANGATISPCGKYRYLLWRTITFADIPPGCVVDYAKRMVVAMLNPSIADAEKNDPTIRRCMYFAAREGCGRLEVVNRYAYRATDPRELDALDLESRRGTMNGLELQRAIIDRSPHLVVVAWGNTRPFPESDGEWEMWKGIAQRRPLFCLGTTKDGSPKHPLARGKSAIRNDTPLQPWKIEAAR